MFVKSRARYSPSWILSNKRVEDARSSSYRAKSHKTREKERKSAGVSPLGANDRRGNELPDVLKLSSIPYVARLRAIRIRRNIHFARLTIRISRHKTHMLWMHAWIARHSVCTHPPPTKERRKRGMQTLKNGSVYPARIESGSESLKIYIDLCRRYRDGSGRRRARRRKEEGGGGWVGIRDVSLIHPNCVPKLDLLQRPICSRRRIIDKARGRLRRLENDPLI